MLRKTGRTLRPEFPGNVETLKDWEDAEA